MLPLRRRHNAPVFDADDPVRLIEYAIVMRHDDHRAIGPDRNLANDSHHALARLRVERGGWFVADE